MKKSKGSVSIKQLASILSLSPGTVSFVLNGRGKEMRISKATQERVLDAARQFGFQPKSRACSPWDARNKDRVLITVFNPQLKGVKNVLGSIVYGMQGAMIQENLPVEIIMHPYRNGNLCDCKNLLSPLCTSGAVICGVSDDDMNFLLEENFDLPIVLFNRANEKYSSVYVEDYEAGYKVASVFHARGHRDAGLIMPSSRGKFGSMRQLGFLDGCRHFGLSVKPHHIEEDELGTDGGYRAAARLLEHGDIPSALFILISEMAAGSLRAIKERDIRVPEGVEIIAYGDSRFEEFLSPSVSTVHMPVEEMAAECLHILLDRIRSGDPRPVSRILPLTMIFRESCPEGNG